MNFSFLNFLNELVSTMILKSLLLLQCEFLIMAEIEENLKVKLRHIQKVLWGMNFFFKIIFYFVFRLLVS